MDLASDFEQIIRQHRLPALDESFRGEGFVLPHYRGFSIANLPATVAELLCVQFQDSGAQARLEPPLPRRAWSDLAGDVRCVVVVILDAVGYLHFRRLLAAEDTAFSRLAQDGTFVPLTSVFPSTTMAAITSLWTGRTPIDHGFLGRKLFLSQFGVLADMIRLMPATHARPGELMDWGWVPEDFIPVPHLAQMLSAVGVKTVTHLYGPHAGGGLSRLFLRGVASVRGFINFSDMWINVRDTLMQRSSEPLLVNVYWSGTDDVAHTYGPDDERFTAALRHMARSMDEDFLGPLSGAARDGTVIMVTADHGQIETPPGRAVHLAEYPALGEMLRMPPAAEPRASYLHVRRGQAAAVRAYVAEHLA
ncbi:alkaline phosphatase family protein, partial [Chloroflexota bacterium]